MKVEDKIKLWETLMREYKDSIKHCNEDINKNRNEIFILQNSMKKHVELVDEYNYRIKEANLRIKELKEIK